MPGHPSMARPITTPDLTGKRFGKLLVIERVESDAKRRQRYLCRCDCGAEKVKFASHLIQGVMKSCGCSQRIGTHRATANRTRTPEFLAWASLFQRCDNPKVAAYKYYGGRGITICKRWRESFENFLADMGLKPGPGFEIDRIDVNGNYTPENCRWWPRGKGARRPYKWRR